MTKRIFTTWKHFNINNIIGPIGSQALYFGNQFYSKNTRKLRYHTFQLKLVAKKFFKKNYMRVILTFTSIRQYTKTQYHNRMPMSRQYIYLVFIFKQQIPKCSILIPNLWKMIAANYELLQVMFKHVLNPFSSISEQLLAALNKKAVLKISW